MKTKYVLSLEEDPLYVFDTLADAEEMMASLIEDAMYEDFIHSVHWVIDMDVFKANVLPIIKRSNYAYYVTEVSYFE